MKTINLILIVCLCACMLPASAKKYYVAANGNDANNGTSTSTPWKTIAKVNSYFASLVAGDSILFRTGDSFYGTIQIGKSGAINKPIVISSYGIKAKPVITGAVTASSFTNLGNGIYRTTVSGAKATLNLVTVNDIPQALGRYPNAVDSGGGYLKYESFGGSTSITDNQLTSTTNWTGAEVVIRKKLWVLDRGKITAHNGTQINYTNTNGSTYDGTVNFGYFIQNDPRTLDKFGEWHFNSTSKHLQMYFGTAAPSASKVRVAILDTLIMMTSKSYITISNLAFEGCNGEILVANTGSYVNILNCDFKNAGVNAINIRAVSNLTIENCTTRNILNNAIIVNNTSTSNVTIKGCVIKNTGSLPGMGASNGGSYKGIVASASSNLLIEYNQVDTTGYLGIEFQGSNVNVRYNVVNYFDFIKDDAGGIYTWNGGTDAAPGPTYTNRVISNNIVMNGIGAPNGRSSNSFSASGIYLDGRSMNVSILNNTVFSNQKNGIHCNNPAGVVISGNTSYNNLNAVSLMRWAWGSISNLTVKNNIFYPSKKSQRCLYYTNSALNTPVANTVQSALSTLGNIDSNIYSMINPVAFNSEIYSTEGGAIVPTSALSLDAWRAVASHDIQSKKPAHSPKEYEITNVVGNNKFANGTFNTNISGAILFGSATTATWDNSGVLPGGCLRMNFVTPVANKYSFIHSPIGAVSSDKKYVLRFTTYGTTAQGIVRAYIRKTSSPYNNLVATQTNSFGMGKTSHEFLFDAPATETGGSFVIEVEQNSGTVYIDNIEFYEAQGTVHDIDAQLRFEYNATKVVKTVMLDAAYTDVHGQLYNGSVTLQPFTSIILLKSITPNNTLARSVTVTNKVVAATPKLKFTVYPNPSSTSFTLATMGDVKDLLTIAVYSVEGKLVFKTSGKAGTNYSFGNGLPAGMYVVKIMYNNNIETLKVFKN